ncbi:MAG: hypothetical protein WC728_05960 [Elusimicrobiota bacterium]
MMALLFSLVTMALMAVGVFLIFSGNTASALRKNYEYQVRTNTTNACLVYGDLLARGRLLDNDPRTPSSNRATLSVGCLAQSGGKCTETITCTIVLKNDNKIHVSIDR